MEYDDETLIPYDLGKAVGLVGKRLYLLRERAEKAEAKVTELEVL